MASTYTSNSGIELITTGEKSGTWGTITNTNLQILERLSNAVGTISLSGTTHTLTTNDGSLSDGQYGVLVFTGSPTGTNTVTISPNDGEHVYIVQNDSGEDVILTQGSGSTVTVENGTGAVVYCDGGGATASVSEVALAAATTLADLGVTASAAELNILDGATLDTAELNILDGATITTAELNILDGVTATASELNILDGATLDTAELNILDGVTATTAELNYLDITTLGSSEASKVVTANADGNVLLTEEVKATAYLDTLVTLSGTSVTVDCDEGNSFTLTTSGNTTFTFDYSGVQLTTDDAYSFFLKLTAGGTHTITWPASVDWAGGSAPDAPASGETDVYVFMTQDGGTNWYGFQAGDAMS